MIFMARSVIFKLLKFLKNKVVENRSDRILMVQNLSYFACKALGG